MITARTPRGQACYSIAVEPTVPCVSCGVPNPWHERFCRACGSPLGGGASIPGASASMVKAGMQIRRRTLKIGWVIGGAFVMMAIGTVIGATILALAAPRVLREGNVEGEDPEAVAGLLVALGAGLLASFFIGGVVIGRLSKGRTIVEPGLAACLASSGLLLVTGALESGFAAALCSAPVLALLAMAGGWLGERWQTAAEPTPPSAAE